MKKYFVRDNTHIDLHLDGGGSHVGSPEHPGHHMTRNLHNMDDLGSVLVTKVTGPIGEHGPHFLEANTPRHEFYNQLQASGRTSVVVRRSSIEDAFSVVGVGTAVRERDVNNEMRSLAKRRASIPDHHFRTVTIPTDRRHSHHGPRIEHSNFLHTKLNAMKHNHEDRYHGGPHRRKSSDPPDKDAIHSIFPEVPRTSPVDGPVEDEQGEIRDEAECDANAHVMVEEDLKEEEEPIEAQTDWTMFSFKKDIQLKPENEHGRLLNAVAELQDGRVVVADVLQEEIIVFNQMLEMINSVRCHNIWRFCAVPDPIFHLAIIFENETKISLTDLESNKKCLSVHAQGFFRDIQCSDNHGLHLYVLCSHGVIMVLDMKGKAVREIETPLADMLHMTFVIGKGPEETFFCSGKYGVAFINSRGEETWRFSRDKDQDDVAITTKEIEDTVAGRPHGHHVLSPHGLAVTESTLYVTDTQNHRVLAISLHDHSSEEVVSFGVQFPFAVGYIHQEWLMVTQNSYVTTSPENSTIKVFKYV